MKIIFTGYTNYYLTVKQTGRSVKSPLKGVSVLLGDQSKIERPDSPVIIEAPKPGIPEKGRYLFSSYFSVSPEEINRIETVGITCFNVYACKYSLSNQEQEFIKQQAGCLLFLK